MIKVNIRFILLMSIFVVVFAVLKEDIYYVMFGGFLSLVILQLIYIFIEYLSTKVFIKFPRKEVTTGDEVSYDIVVCNNNIFPLNYLAINSIKISGYRIPRSKIISLNVFEKKKIKDSIRMDRRGIYNIENIDVLIRDMFGFLTIKKSIKCNVEFKVYPRIYAIESIANCEGENSNLNKSNRTLSESNEFLDIRKYVKGDNPKRISWKLSAKRGELLSKNFEKITDEKIHIFFNFNKSYYSSYKGDEVEELAVSFLLSIINYMIKYSWKINLFICSSSVETIAIDKGRNLEELKEYFINIKSELGVDFFKSISERIDSINTNEWAAIVCPYIDNNVINEAIALRMQGLKIKLFYLYCLDIDREECVKKLEEQGILTYGFKI